MTRQPLSAFLVLVWIALYGGMLFAEESVIEAIELKHRPADELQPLIEPFLEGSDHIVGNGFRLIVKTSPTRLPSLLALVEKLDAAQANLSITVMQSSQKTAEELNAEARLKAVIPLNDPASGGISMRGHIAETERLKDRQNTQVVRTLEGRPAYIKAGQLHPYTSGYYESGYGYRGYANETRFIEASTGFMVVPRLSGDTVTLDISPWSGSMTPGGKLESHSAQSSLRVKLGEWVEIGASGSEEQRNEQGYLRHRRSTRQENVRLLLKVDRID